MPAATQTPVPSSVPPTLPPTKTKTPTPTSTKTPPPRDEDVDKDGDVDCADKRIVTNAFGQNGGIFDLDGSGKVGATDIDLVLQEIDTPGLCGHSADINRDGTVNSRDLEIINGSSSAPPTPTPTPTPVPGYACWGYSPVHVDNPCDLNMDGVIGSGDLAILISRWGTSPAFEP
jgi:hypothetical protein